MKISKFSRFIIITILLLALSSRTIMALPDALSLNVSSVVQSQTNWCWAASGSSKLSYQKSYQSQYNFAVATIGAPPSNIPIGFSTLQAGFTKQGLVTVNTSSLTFEGIKTLICQNKPIMAGIRWAAGGGHILEIYGYNSTGNKVAVMDPFNGAKSMVTYSFFLNNSTYSWMESNY